MQLMLLGPGRIPGDGVFEGIREIRPGCCGYVDVHGLLARNMRLSRTAGMFSAWKRPFSMCASYCWMRSTGSCRQMCL